MDDEAELEASQAVFSSCDVEVDPTLAGVVDGEGDTNMKDVEVEKDYKPMGTEKKQPKFHADGTTESDDDAVLATSKACKDRPSDAVEDATVDKGATPKADPKADAPSVCEGGGGYDASELNMLPSFHTGAQQAVEELMAKADAAKERKAKAAGSSRYVNAGGSEKKADAT